LKNIFIWGTQLHGFQNDTLRIYIKLEIKIVGDNIPHSAFTALNKKECYYMLEKPIKAKTLQGGTFCVFLFGDTIISSTLNKTPFNLAFCDLHLYPLCKLSVRFI